MRRLCSPSFRPGLHFVSTARRLAPAESRLESVCAVGIPLMKQPSSYSSTVRGEVKRYTAIPPLYKPWSTQWRGKKCKGTGVIFNGRTSSPRDFAFAVHPNSGTGRKEREVLCHKLYGLKLRRVGGDRIGALLGVHIKPKQSGHK